jgi:hypothetical protein
VTNALRVLSGRALVCEEHLDKPMDDDCKVAGMPCPNCNPSSRETVPLLPPDFETERNAGR